MTSMTMPSNCNPSRPRSSTRTLRKSEYKQSARNCHANPSRRRTNSPVEYRLSVCGLESNSTIGKTQSMTRKIFHCQFKPQPLALANRDNVILRQQAAGLGRPARALGFADQVLAQGRMRGNDEDFLAL